MLSARLPNQLFEQSPFMNSQQKAFGANASWEKRRPNVQCRLPWPVPFSRPAHGSGATRGAPDWTDQDLAELIFLPLKPRADRNWPAWEIPAADHASPHLFRFWKGEKPPSI
jgi:hypothetical protein